MFSSVSPFIRFRFTRVRRASQDPAHNFSVPQKRVGVTGKRRQCSCRMRQKMFIAELPLLVQPSGRDFVFPLFESVIKDVIAEDRGAELQPSFNRPFEAFQGFISFGLRVSLTFLTRAGRRSAHFRMASSAGHRDCPHDVSLYSTLGGTCG